MPRPRAWAATILSLLSLALMILTAAMPDWIEHFLGVDPDGGSGWAEKLVPVGLAVLAVISGADAIRAWRAPRASAGTGKP